MFEYFGYTTLHYSGILYKYINDILTTSGAILLTVLAIGLPVRRS